MRPDTTKPVATRILVPVLGFRQADRLLPLAKALLGAGADHIVLAGLVGMARDQPLSKGAYRARRRRRDLDNLAATWHDLPLKVDPHVRVTYDLLDDLAALTSRHGCDTIVLRLSSDGQSALGLPVNTVLARLAGRTLFQRGGLPSAPRRILVPSRGGPHAAQALRVALALSSTFGSEISLLHVVPAHDGGPASQATQDSQPPSHHGDPITREINVRGAVVSLVETLKGELRDHQLLVLGTAAREAAKGALGPRTRAILGAVKGSTVLVYAPSEFVAPEVRHPRPSLAAAVGKWFAESTFSADEFADLERLVALKKAQGLTVSLGLPALNEEETIGNVITTVRDELVDRHALLDEIVLIDSDSTDTTVEIAESLGIPVYRHPEILPEVSSHHGKGEALWKSLHVLRGDIIAWIDTDIFNIHPRFVYGLLGPLLVSPRVGYVKGFYRRPLRVGDKLQAGGGGRVTELVARPMLNLFFPELSGIVQPLSGEYAGRREILERVPFFSGYAVETGLLIDILNRFGLSSIAQVDLKVRIHHNKGLQALSKMSFVIIQAIFARLDEQEIIQLLDDPSRSMKLIGDDEGHLFLDVEELSDVERPPIYSLPAYRARRTGLEKMPRPTTGRSGSG